MICTEIKLVMFTSTEILYYKSLRDEYNTITNITLMEAILCQYIHFNFLNQLSNFL